MTYNSGKQQGFALIVSMLVLLILTILVINSVRSSVMNEQMAGGYMDRTRALQAAEQALRQAEGLLLANGELCLSGCSVDTTTVAASATTVSTIPTAWDTSRASRNVTLATDQASRASFQIAQLNDALRSADKGDCKAYSIIGKGVGIDSRTEAHLQTVAYVCPID